MPWHDKIYWGVVVVMPWHAGLAKASKPWIVSNVPGTASCTSYNNYLVLVVLLPHLCQGGPAPPLSR
jgi:hypothetical protein